MNISYEKINPEELQVFDRNSNLIGSIKRETPPPGVAYPWVYRFHPVKGDKWSAFPDKNIVRQKVEAKYA